MSTPETELIAALEKRLAALEDRVDLLTTGRVVGWEGFQPPRDPGPGEPDDTQRQRARRNARPGLLYPERLPGIE